MLWCEPSRISCSSDGVPHIFYADLQVMKGKGLKMY